MVRSYRNTLRRSYFFEFSGFDLAKFFQNPFAKNAYRLLSDADELHRFAAVVALIKLEQIFPNVERRKLLIIEGFEIARPELVEWVKWIRGVLQKLKASPRIDVQVFVKL